VVVIKASTQPRWAKDEYAIIVRSLVWLIPIRPPRIAFIAANAGAGQLAAVKRTSGAAFCHVDNKKHLNQEIEDIIDGNQW